MKYITFYKEDNQFDDILSDPNIKKHIDETMSWKNHLLLGITDNEQLFSYITLKYGEMIRTDLVKNFAPIPNVDYIPIRR